MDRELATRVVIAKILTDYIGGVLRTAKAELAEEMAPGDRVAVGAEAIGVPLGAVTMAHGRRVARVADRRKFTQWVLDHYGEEETMLDVRTAFERKILDGATSIGEPVDPDTGVVIAGVEIVDSDPYLTVRPTAQAREELADQMRNQLALE